MELAKQSKQLVGGEDKGLMDLQAQCQYLVIEFDVAHLLARKACDLRRDDPGIFVDRLNTAQVVRPCQLSGSSRCRSNG